MQIMPNRGEIMVISIPEQHLVRFLCESKRATYAAKDGKAAVKPVFAGSHQLEHRRGGFFYRDVYYGGEYFVGQETVYHKNEPIWGMSYGGGINEGIKTNDTPGIYEFLAAALRMVQENAPFRGPEKFRQGDLKYQNRILGNVHRFSGIESIAFEDIPVYQLHYSGGILKI